ncbi:hypothetical protein K450DRAFT_221695 [Umbelopsis ramanniana AG]|uniref:Centrosomin N-terminal motif 1 domain-containing protein n=1 Tax=Umbelopsis ramanniana AG TaxID=1314678 RepID=A0AAD5EHF4_UMBRA|nr:uncharacterized protein K450DRAFT_221695 [Umbelopsis ramanniana AG]KAI8583554.1 hypothetical protein K450DRAFT_221695 [Umbelopsis ramanniana AG]
MSSAKPSGGTVHGHATPRRFHSPTFGSPAGIVVRPTRSQSPVMSNSTPTKRLSDISHRKRVVSLTPTLGTPSHVTPTPSNSTPLISQYPSHMPSSLDLNDHKSSVPLKEFEKVITDLKKENFNLKLRLFHYEEDNAIDAIENEERLVSELNEQKDLVESLRTQLMKAQDQIALLRRESQIPSRSVGVQTDMVRHDFDFHDRVSPPLHYLSNISSDDVVDEDDLVLSRESSISGSTGSISLQRQHQFVTNAHDFGLVHPVDDLDEDLMHITRQLHQVNLVSPTAQRNRAIGGWLDRVEI